MKRVVSIILVMVMVFSFAPVAFAASDEANAAAEGLYDLGLFQGTGTDANGNPIFDLDRAPTRHEAVTMLVRLLGKDAEAKAGDWDIPFTDVAAWAKPYVGYAYANGLTSGTSATTYSGNQPVTATQYITFVLRALGYDSNRDFQWNKAWELADEIGLTDGRYNAENNKDFLRGDVAIVSYNSLSCEKAVNIFENIPAETEEQKTRFAIMNEYWDTRIDIPDYSKGLTLTWDEARALVGQDIDTVKRYVRTLEDCLYYYCAAGFTQPDGDLKYNVGDYNWHFNYSPQVVFERSEGNCGGNAALFVYLLEGDYDEVGYVSKRGPLGGTGGHVTNYFKDGNMYYVFDLNQFVNDHSKGIYLHTGTNLNETVKDFFDIDDPEEDNPAMMAYTYTGCLGGDAPQKWSITDPVSYLIEGYAENVNIVYETPEEGYVYEFIEVSQDVLDKIEEMRNQR